MKTSPAARRYAKALLELALEAKQAPKIQKDLREVSEAWESSEELRGIFENPAIDADMQRKVVEGLAQRMMLSPMTKNTLLLMAGNRRITEITAMSHAFAAFAEAASQTLQAEVSTPAAMPEAFYTRLKGELEKATGQKVNIVKKQDASLIAGVVTRVGDKVYDGSVRNRLQQLRETLSA
ncbi:MAG: ATP synthase F1 subunit delta [Polyangiales bacterium]